MKTTFRGWRIPGPVPPGTAEAGPGETLDALSGQYRIFQLERGHRFSTDDLLVAWHGTSWCPRAERVLDLGSGIGTVAMVAAWRLPGSKFVTVEAQEESIGLAWRSVAWNGLTDRFELRHGDFRDPGVLQEGDVFDLVLGSPPYFPPGSGLEGDHPQKIACRFEMRGDIGDYCQVAAKHLAAGGWFSFVFPISPTTQHARAREAVRAAGLVIVRERPVTLREGDPSLLGLFGAMRRADLPESMHEKTWIEPPLIIRTRSGEIHPEYAAVKLAFGFPP